MSADVVRLCDYERRPREWRPWAPCEVHVLPHVRRQFYRDGRLSVIVAPLPGGGYLVEAINADGQ